MVMISGTVTKYKYKAKDYRKKVKKYWKYLEEIEENFYRELSLLENVMRRETKVEDIEFFFGDGGVVGIGNESRTMELISRR